MPVMPAGRPRRAGQRRVALGERHHRVADGRRHRRDHAVDVAAAVADLDHHVRVVGRRARGVAGREHGDERAVEPSEPGGQAVAEVADAAPGLVERRWRVGRGVDGRAIHDRRVRVRGRRRARTPDARSEAGPEAGPQADPERHARPEPRDRGPLHHLRAYHGFAAGRRQPRGTPRGRARARSSRPHRSRR